MRIGIDFDNTIADYDRVFPRAARQLGMLEDAAIGKIAVRETLRALPDGEQTWQRLQGQVYGRFMPDAAVYPGVTAFLSAAASARAQVFVVSHKTAFGHFDPQRINLHDAAMRWLIEKSLLAESGTGIRPGHVHFLETRQSKIAKIAELALDVFIDDLPEVFLEPSFPAGIRRLLFANGAAVPDGPFQAAASWNELHQIVFNGQS